MGLAARGRQQWTPLGLRLKLGSEYGKAFFSTNCGVGSGKKSGYAISMNAGDYKDNCM